MSIRANRICNSQTSITLRMCHYHRIYGRWRIQTHTLMVKENNNCRTFLSFTFLHNSPRLINNSFRQSTQAKVPKRTLISWANLTSNLLCSIKALNNKGTLQRTHSSTELIARLHLHTNKIWRADEYTCRGLNKTSAVKRIKNQKRQWWRWSLS